MGFFLNFISMYERKCDEQFDICRHSVSFLRHCRDVVSHNQNNTFFKYIDLKQGASIQIQLANDFVLIGYAIHVRVFMIVVCIIADLGKNVKRAWL